MHYRPPSSVIALDRWWCRRNLADVDELGALRLKLGRCFRRAAARSGSEQTGGNAPRPLVLDIDCDPGFDLTATALLCISIDQRAGAARSSVVAYISPAIARVAPA